MAIWCVFASNFAESCAFWIDLQLPWWILLGAMPKGGGTQSSRANRFHFFRQPRSRYYSVRLTLAGQRLPEASPAPPASLAGLIFHSDRGSQYGSGKYRALLAHAGALQRRSARTDHYHNAWSESFTGTLKKAKMLQGGSFIDEHDARTEIFDFIEGYYNTHRKHSPHG